MKLLATWIDQAGENSKASRSATYEIIDSVAVVTVDDGKANGFGLDMIAGAQAYLDRAAKEAGAVVLTGRKDVLSGGFDLKVIRDGHPKAVSAMIDAGARLMMRLYGLPQPLVIAATGHAVALGAFCLLTADHHVGAEGDFRIGLNEVAIGMSLPPFGLMLANERLSKRHLARATLGAILFSPQAAKDAGFLDEVAAPGGTALAAACKLASLDGAAFAVVKSSQSGPAIAAVLAELEG